MSARLCVCATLVFALAGGAIAGAQSASPPESPAQAGTRPGLWIVAGGGGMLARGHCGNCDREGQFFYGPGILIDAGIQINQRVDAGVEVSWGSTRIEELDPIRTTFVLGVGQFRPWADRGFSLRGGMGIGFVGNGIHNFTQRHLSPPFTTNGLAVVIGLGWEFMREERMTFQILATQHVAAIGELTTESGSIKNVVGNYWLVGGTLVIR